MAKLRRAGAGRQPLGSCGEAAAKSREAVRVTREKNMFGTALDMATAYRPTLEDLPPQNCDALLTHDAAGKGRKHY